MQAIDWDVIYSYTRAQAIEDGTLEGYLVPSGQGDSFDAIVRQAGIRLPLAFSLLVVRDHDVATLTTLDIVCGPGDDAEPVLTIMFPGED